MYESVDYTEEQLRDIYETWQHLPPSCVHDVPFDQYCDDCANKRNLWGGHDDE